MLKSRQLAREEHLPYQDHALVDGFSAQRLKHGPQFFVVASTFPAAPHRPPMCCNKKRLRPCLPYSCDHRGLCRPLLLRVGFSQFFCPRDLASTSFCSFSSLSCPLLTKLSEFVSSLELVFGGQGMMISEALT